MLLPTPGDSEAATKLMVKEAIPAGAGDFDLRADVALWRKRDVTPSDFSFLGENERANSSHSAIQQQLRPSHE